MSETNEPTVTQLGWTAEIDGKEYHMTITRVPETASLDDMWRMMRLNFEDTVRQVQANPKTPSPSM